MFVEDENAVRLEVEVSRNSCAGEEIVHGLVKLYAVWSSLVVEQEKDVRIVSVAHADFDLIGYFEQRVNVAHLPKPREQIGVEMLMALGADVDGFTQAEGVHGHGGTACVEVFGVGSEDLAVLGFDDVAP